MMTLPIYRFALLLAATVLCGCVTGEKISRLHTGMAKAEVVQVLGTPDGDKQVGEFEVYRYSNRLDWGIPDYKRIMTSDWPSDRADYYTVVFKKDRVVEYGTGQVRQQSNGTVAIVPL
jgi:hypothetical protein